MAKLKEKNKMIRHIGASPSIVHMQRITKYPKYQNTLAEPNSTYQARSNEESPAILVPMEDRQNAMIAGVRISTHPVGDLKSRRNS